MARVTFDFDSDGYISIRGERYSALEILNDAGQTALDWMLAQDNEELRNIANSWGLKPENDDRTGGKEETLDGQADDKNDNTSVDESVDKSETGGGLSTEELASTSDKLNILFGFKMKNGVVQKDKNGRPERNTNAAIKTAPGVEPKIQSDGTIDIPGDVTINLLSKEKSLNVVENGKFTIKFGKIEGNFICRGVKLTSLEGGPKIVNGTCDYSKNDITSLTGAPDEVVKFIADDNPKLTTLAGGPKKIKGITDPAKSAREVIYSVTNCALTTLENNGITEFGPGGFDCSKNKLTSLAGLGVLNTNGVVSFYCSKNDLTTLNGVPKPRKDVKTGKTGNYDISHNLQISTFPQFFADFEIDDFKANGLSLTSLSFAPKQVYGNFECLENKSSTKITNQSIGKDRFKPTGFEETAQNRIVKIDGEFITSEGSWKDKTYDSNTVYVKPKEDGGSSVPINVESTVYGGVVTINNPEYTAVGTSTKRAGKVYLQVMSSFGIGNAGISPVIENGVHASGTVGGSALKYDFISGTVNSGFGYLDSKNEYDGKYGIPVDFSKATSGKIKNRWVERGYKNFINWSLYELRRTGWGSAQPTGNFIKDGKYYGAKPSKKGNINAAIINGKPDIVYGNGLFSSGLTPKPGVSVAAGGSRLIIQNGSNTNLNDNDYRGYPFLGKVTINGKNQFFAGASSVGPTPKLVGDCILSYFNKIGAKVDLCAIGDGGGSTAFVVNGNTITGGGRTFPILIYW